MYYYIMSQLSEEQAFMKANFSDSVSDVIVHIRCHGALILEKKNQESTGRIDSYDLFNLPDFFNNILLFMLSGVGNSASDTDPMLSDFLTIKPGRTFSDIFNYLDDRFNNTRPQRVIDYQVMKAPLGSYSVQPFIEDGRLTNVFINKYLYIGGWTHPDDDENENDHDIYITDNEGNKMRISDLNSVAKFLAKKRGISYYVARDLVEIAVSVDKGKIAGWDVIIPGDFRDIRRLKDERIQRITLKEVFFLLYLLGYENPFILDESCSGHYSSKEPQSERLTGRTAAKHLKPFINVHELLIFDDKGNSNFTSYNKDSFDGTITPIIRDNEEYIDSITKALGCSKKIALAVSDAETLFVTGGVPELVRAAVYVMNQGLNCTEEQAVEGIMNTKNSDGSLNPEKAIRDLRNKRGGKRIKKTIRRKRINKSIKKKRIKKTMRRKTK